VKFKDDCCFIASGVTLSFGEQEARRREKERNDVTTLLLLLMEE
jgi:hypothetical protein